MHITDKTKTDLKWKIFQKNGAQNQAGLAILLSDKADFKPKLVKRAKEGHLLILKIVLQQEEITTLNILAQNVSTLNIIK
jgi:hypothetical protein